MSRGLILRTLGLMLAATLMSSAAAAGQDPSASVPAQSHEHGGHRPSQAVPPPPPTGLPPVTDESRKAAFPELHSQHTVHDDAIFTYVLFDQLEWQAGHGTTGLTWNNKGWIGGDVNRFWFRTEGEGDGGDLSTLQVHALYGRAISRWWDLVAGVRQDIDPGSPQTWAAIGVQGLAPYWFDVDATAYVGQAGRTQFRFETEYELLVTNRLVLQPLVEVNVNGKADPEHEAGAGLSSMEAGLRLRYEIRREFAPYVGLTWNRKFFGTADLAKARGEGFSGTRLTLGARVWF